MKPNEPLDEAAIQALLENLPMSQETPENLKARLIDLAASPTPRHRAVRRPIFAFAFAGALTVAAVAVFLSIPATAKSWSMVKQAVEGVKTMQMEIRELDKEKPETTRVAFGPGMVLVEPQGGAVVFVNNGTVQIYEPGENVVREFPMPEGILPDVAKDVMGEISMKKILADNEREFGKQNIKVGPVRNERGRQVYDVTFTKPAGEQNESDGEDLVNMVADARTDLPIFIETFKRVNGQLRKTTEIVARYNDALDANALKPKFPPDAKIEKFDISKFIDGNGKPPKIEWD